MPLLTAAIFSCSFIISRATFTLRMSYCFPLRISEDELSAHHFKASHFYLLLLWIYGILWGWGMESFLEVSGLTRSASRELMLRALANSREHVPARWPYARALFFVDDDEWAYRILDMLGATGSIRSAGASHFHHVARRLCRFHMPSFSDDDSNTWFSFEIDAGHSFSFAKQINALCVASNCFINAGKPL